ncbi:hypothetical protein HDU85_002314 [Gaertneriomyces sp. JEL0708]|nr:hypothetical protein BC832DRAFT_545475 [Gaertneriomyces semiglobifer]KAJ3183288.1 hypothetical protein HDU85_002314 [Gaertneriomyces sp. JEL0708]
MSTFSRSAVRASRALVAIRRPLGVRTMADASHGSKPTTPMHKEEWLEVARSWPHEYHYPGHFKTGGPDEIYPAPSTAFDKATHTGAETITQAETFNSPFWTKAIFFVATGFGLYRLNEYYASDKDVHPITQWIGELQSKYTAEKAQEESKHWIAVHQREADDRLILAKEFKPRSYRASFPGQFERGSVSLIEPGSQIDVSNVKIKHRWEE